MRNGRTKARRLAELAQVRQDILIKLEDVEARIPSASPPPEREAPAKLEAIAQRMLDAIGGGEFRIMLKGEQTLEQRAAELFDEEQRQQKRRW